MDYYWPVEGCRQTLAPTAAAAAAQSWTALEEGDRSDREPLYFISLQSRGWTDESEPRDYWVHLKAHLYSKVMWLSGANVHLRKDRDIKTNDPTIKLTWVMLSEHFVWIQFEHTITVGVSWVWLKCSYVSETLKLSVSYYNWHTLFSGAAWFKYWLTFFIRYARKGA